MPDLLSALKPVRGSPDREGRSDIVRQRLLESAKRHEGHHKDGYVQGLELCF